MRLAPRELMTFKEDAHRPSYRPDSNSFKEDDVALITKRAAINKTAALFCQQILGTDAV